MALQALADGSIAFVTSTTFKLLTADFDQVKKEYRVVNNTRIIQCSIEKNKMVLALQGGTLLYFDLSENADDNRLEPLASRTFSHEIGSMALSERSDIVYVALRDYPN